MITYILILIIETNGYPVSMSQAEYSSQERCNRAKEKIEARYEGNGNFKIYGTCEKK